MAATVTVRAKAFGDSRIVFLGQLLGCSWNDAFVRVIRLWSVCAEQQTDTPEARFIRACLEHPQGEQHLVESGLGDDLRRDPSLAEGVVRVRGCDETDWYFAAMEQRGAQEAGRARAALADRDAAGRFVPTGPPALDQRTSSVGPASDHSPDLGSEICSESSARKLPDPQAIVHAERGAARVDQRRRLFGDAWTYAGLKHHELKAEGIDPNARNCWGVMPDAGSFEAQQLFARIDELTAGDAPDWKRARELVRNRIDVAAAEVRAAKPPTLRWFIPARMWDAKSFAIAKDLSPEQAAQPRARDRFTSDAPETPVRRIATAK